MVKVVDAPLLFPPQLEMIKSAGTTLRQRAFSLDRTIPST